LSLKFRNNRVAIVATLFLFILHLTKISTPVEWTWVEVLSWDKLVHVLLFFSWMMIVLSSPISIRLAKLYWAFVGLGFGLILESAQALLTTYRSGEWWDVLADSVGIAIAFLVIQKRT
jgi:VanZ family protein